MSDIITAYPTASVTEKTAFNVLTAVYNYIKTIPGVTDFFDEVAFHGTSDDSYINLYITLTKGASVIRLSPSSANAQLKLNNNATGNSAASGLTASFTTSDAPVSYVKGTNGTTVIWFGAFSEQVFLIFNQFSGKYFIATAAVTTSILVYYSDTATAVSPLVAPFNGSNLGKGGQYIAQPYYHLGINTGDLYTFDGGSADIPYGKFSFSGKNFVRVASNLAVAI